MKKNSNKKEVEKTISKDRQAEIELMLKEMNSKDEKSKNEELISNQDTKRGNGEKPSLVVKNFTKKYRGSKIPAVEGASFEVMPGEFHGFIGANGAGKTTTIKSLIGAYAKFDGDVTMFGHKHSTIEAKKRIGYIPEAAKFPKGMSTLQYITYMSYLSGMSMKESKKYALKELQELGLEKVMKRSPNTFSSGQKKKVLLAQALVHNPDIIIMDEPAANLDPKARFEFFQELKSLQKQGKSIFISSHILAELDKFVDSVTIVDGGKIVFTGSMATATSNPEMKYLITTETPEELKKVKAILKKLKIDFSFEEEEGVVAKMVDRKTILKFMETCTIKEIVLDTFKNNKMSLEDVYKKYVLLGSRETGTGKAGE